MNVFWVFLAFFASTAFGIQGQDVKLYQEKVEFSLECAKVKSEYSYGAYYECSSHQIRGAVGDFVSKKSGHLLSYSPTKKFNSKSKIATIKVEVKYFK